jgi:hypothetical protein
MNLIRPIYTVLTNFGFAAHSVLTRPKWQGNGTDGLDLFFRKAIRAGLYRRPRNELPDASLLAGYAGGHRSAAG